MRPSRWQEAGRQWSVVAVRSSQSKVFCQNTPTPSISESREEEFFGLTRNLRLRFSLRSCNFCGARSMVGSRLDRHCSMVQRLQLGFAETPRYGIALISHRDCKLLKIFQDRQFLLKW